MIPRIFTEGDKCFGKLLLIKFIEVKKEKDAEKIGFFCRLLS